PGEALTEGILTVIGAASFPDSRPAGSAGFAAARADSGVSDRAPCRATKRSRNASTNVSATTPRMAERGFMSAVQSQSESSREHGHVVKHRGGRGARGAGHYRQADVDVRSHRDAMRADLRPVHSIRGLVTGERVVGADYADPERRRDARVTAGRGGIVSGAAALLPAEGASAVGAHEGVLRSTGQALANHHADARAAAGVRERADAGFDLTVAAQGLVDEPEIVGGAADISGATDGVGAVGVPRVGRRGAATDVGALPRRGQRVLSDELDLGSGCRRVSEVETPTTGDAAAVASLVVQDIQRPCAVR